MDPVHCFPLLQQNDKWHDHHRQQVGRICNRNTVLLRENGFEEFIQGQLVLAAWAFVE